MPCPSPHLICRQRCCLEFHSTIVSRLIRSFYRSTLDVGPASVAYPFGEPKNDIRKRNFGHLMTPQEKVLTVDDNGKIQTSASTSSLSSPLGYQGVLKKTPSTTVQGMRTIKSLSGRLPVLDYCRFILLCEQTQSPYKRKFLSVLIASSDSIRPRRCSNVKHR